MHQQRTDAVLQEAIASFATNVAVITTTDASGAPRGCTGTAWAESADPAVVLTTLKRTSRTLMAIREAVAFGVSLLSEAQTPDVRRFAGPEPGRFADAVWSAGNHLGMPLLEGSVASFECEVEAEHAFGSYVILVGAVRSASVARERAALVHYRGTVAGFRGGNRVPEI